MERDPLQVPRTLAALGVCDYCGEMRVRKIVKCRCGCWECGMEVCRDCVQYAQGTDCAHCHEED